MGQMLYRSPNSRELRGLGSFRILARNWSSLSFGHLFRLTKASPKILP
jgi:hypothetical protein